ncbi:MAG: acyl-CoA synthetase, long-chain fatty acid:CoA ligase [Acidimicrobiia bacterium]|nr:acyl-CoA synthetase, long-chain fatty acid:CoA ligase [Acidimicrobiia bacterium]
MLRYWIDRDDRAILGASFTWSGAELLARAAGAAEHIDSLAVDAGTPIPALFTASAAAFAYVIGAASFGCPLAPLGPRLTAHELTACVSSLPPGEIILCDPDFEALAQQVAAATGRRAVTVTAPSPGLASALNFDPPPDAVAFILHTSGTSGLPKPVHYDQATMAKRARMNTDLFGFGPGCVAATASPFHHIAGLGIFTVALAAGSAIIPVPAFSVEAWKWLGEMGTTHAVCVPTMLEILLEADALALPSLRLLQYGASPIHPETLRRVLDTLPDVDLLTLYGQTEGSPITMIDAATHRRIVGEGRFDLLTSVGWAVPGASVSVHAPDEQGIGEVHAQAPHFFRVDDDGVLRTGDFGRLGDDGELYLVGRKGDKIIRGGENIYPAEVEEAIAGHPAVREVAVTGVADRKWGEIVRAVVVAADPDHPPEPETLRAYTRQRLAGFKVPTEWIFADALPRNAAGKLLRRLLDRDPAQPGTAVSPLREDPAGTT